jgi:hypothetical protein
MPQTPIVEERSLDVMSTNAVRVDRVLVATRNSNGFDDKVISSWRVVDRLLMIFAAFIALVLAGSVLTLLILSIRELFR